MQLPKSESNRLLRFVIAAIGWVSFHSVSVAAFDHSHGLWEKTLQQFVQAGRVDYAGLKAAPAELDAYLQQLAGVSRDEFQTWNENEQLAFLINLYNASTVRLVIDHYPVKNIKSIGGILTGPWSERVVRVFGQTISLETVEHQMLRRDFGEPAIHFALVCAARGCPDLRSEAYTANRLRQQLFDQGRRFLSTPEKNSIDVRNRIARLSPIFKWFKTDFERRSGSVLEFIQYYLSPELSDALGEGEFRIKYTDYDWSLNDLSRDKK